METEVGVSNPLSLHMRLHHPIAEMQVIGARERQLSKMVALKRLGRRLPLVAIRQSFCVLN